MLNNKYRIDLLASTIDGWSTSYDIDDDFFHSIDGLVEHGQIHTTVHTGGSAHTRRYVIHIHSVGTVAVPCDRCLADVTIPIDTDDELAVMLGDEYSDEGDTVIIPETDGYIDISQFIYEFIVLSLPIKRVHEPGQCDEQMLKVLSSHLAADEQEEDDTASDE